MAAMPVPAAVPVMSPTYLFRPEILNLGLARDSGMNISIRRRQKFLSARQTRRQRRGLHARGHRGGPGGNPNGKFQKVATFHDVSLLVFSE
jgi:hypothetical protein